MSKIMRGLAIYGAVLFGLILIWCISNITFGLGYEAGNSIAGLAVSIPILTFCVLYLWKEARSTKTITRILRFLALYNIIVLGIIIIGGVHGIIFGSEYGHFIIVIGLSVFVPMVILCHKYFWGEVQKEVKKRFEKRRKPRIACEEWARFALEQFFSEKWNKLRRGFCVQMKHMLGISISEQSFLAELLGAQLVLLSFVTTHTNLDLGIAVTIMTREYLKKLPPATQESVNEAYRYCNNKVAEYGKKGLSGYDAIADGCTERLNLATYSNFSRRLVAEFETLGNTWISDARQYRFKK